MNLRVILIGAGLVTFGLGACSHGATTATTSTTSTPTGPTTSVKAGSPSPSPTSSTTAVQDPNLAGQPSATTRAALGFAAGYQETTIEMTGHQFIHRYQPAMDTPGTQVHCPAVVATVGSTFVCQVDANTTSSFDEPLKVDALAPALNLEFAVINPANFICSAHAAWVVQAMAKVGMPCKTSPTTGQGQGGQGGQGGQ